VGDSKATSAENGGQLLHFCPVTIRGRMTEMSKMTSEIILAGIFWAIWVKKTLQHFYCLS